jgi:hypothetical protein
MFNRLSAHARRSLLSAVVAALVLLALAGPVTAAPATFLQGASARSFSSTLVRQGFACTGPRQAGERVFSLCQKTDRGVNEYVHIWGADSTRIDAVEAGVICFECNVARRAKPLFALVAGLSLSGKQPTAAQTWIAQNVKSGGALDWRGLSLRIDAKPRVRSLSISPA